MKMKKKSETFKKALRWHLLLEKFNFLFSLGRKDFGFFVVVVLIASASDLHLGLQFFSYQGVRIAMDKVVQASGPVDRVDRAPQFRRVGQHVPALRDAGASGPIPRTRIGKDAHHHLGRKLIEGAGSRRTCGGLGQQGMLDSVIVEEIEEDPGRLFLLEQLGLPNLVLLDDLFLEQKQLVASKVLDEEWLENLLFLGHVGKELVGKLRDGLAELGPKYERIRARVSILNHLKDLQGGKRDIVMQN